VGRLLIDDAPSITAAVDGLVDAGRKRIAFIGADETMSSGKGRVAAFRTALHARSMSADPALVRTGAPGFAMGRMEMNALLDRSTPPDAVICGGFEISNGALDACLRRKVDIPASVSFVGFGNPSSYRWIAGGISTIDMSADDIAQRAMALLLDETAAGKMCSPTQYLVRGST